MLTGFVKVHGLDLVMIYISMGLALIAGFVNLRLTLQGPRTLRPLIGAVSALAFFYSAAYAVLLFGPYSQADWTRGIRGASLVVWLLVWTYMPVHFAQIARRLAVRTAVKKVEAAQQILEHVASSLGVDPPEVEGDLYGG